MNTLEIKDKQAKCKTGLLLNQLLEAINHGNKLCLYAQENTEI